MGHARLVNCYMYHDDASAADGVIRWQLRHVPNGDPHVPRLHRAAGLQDKIGFRDISAPDLATQSFLADNDLTPAAVFARFHTVKDDGTVLKNSAAFSELWQHMPGWRSLHYLLKMPGMPLIADMVYSGFLEVRKTDTFKKMNRALLIRYVQN